MPPDGPLGSSPGSHVGATRDIRQRWLTVGRVARTRLLRYASAVALAITIVACGSSASPEASADGPAIVVSIDRGLSPRMRPEQVAAIVINQIHGMERLAGRVVVAPRILRITATSAAAVSRLEPGAGEPGQPELGIEWVVRAEGTFTTNRGPVSGAASVAGSGFFQISDGDGSVVGMGFP